jgi:hypothetical protein
MAAQPFSVLQQLTTTRGLPKYLQVVQDIAFCGLGCGLGNSTFATKRAAPALLRPHRLFDALLSNDTLVLHFFNNSTMKVRTPSGLKHKGLLGLQFDHAAVMSFGTSQQTPLSHFAIQRTFKSSIVKICKPEGVHTFKFADLKSCTNVGIQTRARSGARHAWHPRQEISFLQVCTPDVMNKWRIEVVKARNAPSKKLDSLISGL